MTKRLATTHQRDPLKATKVGARWNFGPHATSTGGAQKGRFSQNPQ